MNRITCLIHSVRLGQSWPPNVADSVTFPGQMITGFSPYHTGRVSIHWYSAFGTGFRPNYVQNMNRITCLIHSVRLAVLAT